MLATICARCEGKRVIWEGQGSYWSALDCPDCTTTATLTGTLPAQPDQQEKQFGDGQTTVRCEGPGLGAQGSRFQAVNLSAMAADPEPIISHTLSQSGPQRPAIAKAGATGSQKGTSAPTAIPPRALCARTTPTGNHSGAPLTDSAEDTRDALVAALERAQKADRRAANLETTCALLLAGFCIAAFAAVAFGREALHYARLAGVRGF